jgi:hypothetical protein
MTTQNPIAQLTDGPVPTTFVVNVMHVKPGQQDETFRLIQDVVRYVAGAKPGFLWSSLARSTDGLTVVNIEAISDVGDVDTFFADPEFQQRWARLDAVTRHEFHTYRVDDLVLPALTGG